MAKKNNHSLVSRGLKYKLKIAFCLMCVIPLLVLLSLVSNYIFPQMGLRPDIAIIILIAAFIAIIGYFVIKEVFDNIVSVSAEAKLIAAGDIDRSLKIVREDEIGDLSGALNQLTLRIRSNMDELKTYSEKTNEINIEIQKRVIVLSSLLQISSIIAQGTNLDEVLKLIVEKSRLLASSESAYLFLKDSSQPIFGAKVIDGPNSQQLLKIKIEPSDKIFDKLIKINKPLIIDKANALPGNLAGVFSESFNLKNALSLPVYLKGEVIGILGIGNTKNDFLYTKDDMGLLDIFSKQIAIAMENEILVHRIEKLEIKDSLTGLYNANFITSHLDDEIKRAIKYQRPCSFILVNIDNFQKFYQNYGSIQAEGCLKKAASLIKDSVTEIDRVARFGDNEFAIVLPERNKRQAQEIAEEIRKKIDFSFSEESDINKRLTVSGSLSENPLDGINAKELIAKAKAALLLAKNNGKNRISN